MNISKLACTSLMMFGLINSSIAPPIFLFPENLSSSFNYNPDALAKGGGGGGGGGGSRGGGGSSGGRSRGGSLSAPSKSAPKSGNSSDSPSNSNNNSSSDSNNNNNKSNNNNNNNNNNQSAPAYQAPLYVNPNPVIVTSGSSSTNNGAGGFVLMIILLMVGGGSIALLIWWLRSRGLGQKKSATKQVTELGNEIVTITCVQIALLSQAREIQARLSQLAAESDLSTSEGLVAQLQETVLALLRTPENWTHGRSTSRTVPNLKEAEVLFEQMSITERQKFAAETLVNVGGKIRRQQIELNPEPDIAEYIVVTLLIGTDDDQPLFPEVRTEEDLKAALNRLGAIPPDYLMIFELLWTPTEENDSLTYDQLLANYTDIKQLI